VAGQLEGAATGVAKRGSRRYNMAQVKALFYLPLKDNDGRDLTAEIGQVETELYALFAGWTFRGDVKGAYRMDDGTLSGDVNAAYEVILDEARVPDLEQVLRDFRRSTLQESIYLEIQYNIDVRFLR
jgi:hypothetical protein